MPKQINVIVAEREYIYTRKEMRRALNVDEFIRSQGYLIESESIGMVRDGNIEGIPHTVSDMKAFYDIHGPPIKHIRERSTKKRSVGNSSIDKGLKEQQKQ